MNHFVPRGDEPCFGGVERSALTQAQIDSYRRNGFVQLDDVVTGEHLKRIRDTVTAAVQAEVRDDRRAFHEKSSYEQIFIQKVNLWRRHPANIPEDTRPRVTA